MRVDTLLHPPQVGGDDARRDPCGACVENSPDEAALNKSFHRCVRVCCSSRPARQRRRVLPHCATARTLGKATEPQLSWRPPIAGDRHENFLTSPSAAVRIPPARPLKRSVSSVLLSVPVPPWLRPDFNSICRCEQADCSTTAVLL